MAADDVGEGCDAQVTPRLRWTVLARAVVSAGLLGWLALSVSWGELVQVLAGVNLAWIGVAVALIVASMAVSVVKWDLVLRALGISLPWVELWRAYWAGLFFNNFLPSSIGGDASRIAWAGRAAGDTAGAAASVAVERLLATTGLALTGLAASALATGRMWAMVALLAALAVVSLAFLGFVCAASLPAWVRRRGDRLSTFIARLAQHCAGLRGERGKLVPVLTLSVAFQVTVVGVNYAIFRALGVVDLSWWDALYVVPVTSAAAMLPVGINGYGVREGAYVTLLGLYHVPRSAALASSLLFAFLVSLCSVYGGLMWLNPRTRGDRRRAGVAGVFREQDSQGRNAVRE